MSDSEASAARALSSLLDDVIEVSATPIRRGEELRPFLVFETKDAGREVQHILHADLEATRRRAAEFAASTQARRVAFVSEGHVARDQEAIIVEVQEAGDETLAVFYQRFRRKAGLRRTFKLMGQPTLAGTREVA